MGPDLADFSSRLHAEVENYTKSHPGKTKEDALEKVYIRFTQKDGKNTFVVEKKSWGTKIKNFFSAARRQQYDFKKNYEEIVKRFPASVKDQAQYEALKTLAEELNTILDHVNDRRFEKDKSYYDLTKLSITYEPPQVKAPIVQTEPPVSMPVVQEKAQEQSRPEEEAPLVENPAAQTQVPVSTPVVQQQPQQQPANPVQTPPAEKQAQKQLPGKLDKSKIPSLEQQRIMLEGISGRKAGIAANRVEPQGHEAVQPQQNEPQNEFQNEFSEEPQRQIRQLPRKDKNRRPTKGDAFKRMQTKQAEAPVQPASQKAPPKAPVVEQEPAPVVAQVSKPKVVPAELRDFVNTNSRHFQNWMNIDLQELIKANPEDPIEAIAEALTDDTLHERFSGRLSPVATRPAGWWDVATFQGWNTANDNRPLISGLVADMKAQFEALVEGVFDHADNKDSARVSMPTLNKLANLFERAEFLLEAHDEDSDNYVTAKYIEAVLLAEKLYEAVNEEYDGNNLPDALGVLLKCFEDIVPHFVNKDGTMKSVIRQVETQNSPLNNSLGALRLAAKQCFEMGYAPNELLQEFSERILPPLTASE